MTLTPVAPFLTHADKLKVVSVSELKQHLHITHDDENYDLALAIESAYDYLSGPNGWLGRCSLLNENWECYLPSHTDSRRELPMRPLIGASVDSFEVRASDGTYSAVDAGLFHVSRGEVFPYLQRNGFTKWPYVGFGYHEQAYRVRFTAGFGTNGQDVPSPIRLAIRMLAGHWYKTRETVGEPGQEVLYGLKSLAGRYRVVLDH